MGEAGGINLYNYVGNDPVNFYDPLGLYPISGPNGPVGSGSGLADPSLFLPSLPPMMGQGGGFNNGFSLQTGANIIGYSGLGLTGLEYGSGPATIGSNLKPYWNGWGGGSRGNICTVKIGEFAHDLGPLGFYAGTGVDSLRWFNGDPDMSGGKLWLNASMGAVAWKGGPLGAAAGGLYFLFDGYAGEHLHDFPIYSIPAL